MPIPITKQSPGIIGKVKREHQIDRALEKLILKLKAQDILYLRNPYPFPGISKILRQPRACKIVIEYQAIEPSEYRLKGKYWYLLIDFLFGNAIRKYTDAIVGVTDEITRYEVSRSGDHEKPHVTIGNGFDVASVPIRQLPAYNGDLHLLCVANVNRWHGLDRLFQGLAAYNETPKVILHIAGDGAELPHLQKLAGDIGITDRVVFHGFTTGKALDALFDQCHIAVGSLGIHRIGLKEASILKAREYCARGIPFIYGIPDPDFPADFPYILHLPTDESPINIEQILTFAQEVCADPDHLQKMRHYAEEHLDWSVKVEKLKNFLETLVEEGQDVIIPESNTAPLTVKGLKAPGGTILSSVDQSGTVLGSSKKRKTSMQNTKFIRSQGDNELAQEIFLAKDRLHEKLLALDIGFLGIKEYNQRYLGNKLKNIDSQLDLYGYLLRLCLSNSSLPIQQAVFVDYGGGSGILSLLAKELGIGNVIYVDIYDGSCNDVKTLSNILGLPLDHIICGDVEDLISFVQDNSITVNSIASYDVLEHIYDVEGHFKKLAFLQKDYFRIVYASGANAKNPRIARNLQKQQMRAEHKNRETVWGHKERDSLRAYYDMRKDIIASHALELDSNEIDRIARVTRGLMAADIIACVDEYLHQGYISYSNSHPTNTCDPYTGNWCEHLMETQWLEDILKESGYSVEIMNGYYHCSQSPSLPKRFICFILNNLIYLLGKHRLFIAPYFIVFAEHKAASLASG